MTAFMVGVFVLGPVLALALVLYANRLDRRDGEQGDGMTFFYAPGAVLSLVLIVVWATTSVVYADDVPIGDNCALLEPWSWPWILLGCIWGR
jgi:hypothetical protein